MDVRLEPRQRIEYLRTAAKYNPFSHDARTAAAGTIAVFALNSNQPDWLQAARAEIRHTLEIESTDAVLLVRGIMVNLAIGDTQEADFYFQQLERVDKKQTLFRLVDNHQEGRSPVAANP